MVKRGKFLSKTGRNIVVVILLAIVLCSSLAVACESGICSDKSSYKTNSDVRLSYSTDIFNGSHVIIIQKDKTTVATFDQGTNNSSEVTWNCGPAEGSYTVQLLVNGSKYSSCSFTVRNDDIAPTTTYRFSKSKKPDGSYDTGVKLSFSATDNEGGSGVAAIYYWGIHGDDHITYSSPIEFNKAGTYMITFKAMDKAGNLEMVNGKYRTLTFSVTAPAPEPTPTPTPIVTPTIIPTIEPTAKQVPITETAHDVSDPMNGTEALFTAEPASATSQSNSGPGNIAVVGAVAGIAVIAGAALLVFRRL